MNDADGQGPEPSMRRHARVETYEDALQMYRQGVVPR